MEKADLYRGEATNYHYLRRDIIKQRWVNVPGRTALPDPKQDPTKLSIDQEKIWLGSYSKFD